MRKASCLLYRVYLFERKCLADLLKLLFGIAAAGRAAHDIYRVATTSGANCIEVELINDDLGRQFGCGGTCDRTTGQRERFAGSNASRHFVLLECSAVIQQALCRSTKICGCRNYININPVAHVIAGICCYLQNCSSRTGCFCLPLGRIGYREPNCIIGVNR